MSLLSGIIMAIVIGLVITVGAFAVIQKVYAEKRKDSDDAMEKIQKIFEELPKMWTSMYELIQKKEKEDREQYKRSLEIVHEDDY